MECIICMEKTQFTEQRIKPRYCNDVCLKCNHVFHRKCIKQWFVRNDSCPMCREEIKFREGGYFKMFILLCQVFSEYSFSVIDDITVKYIYYDLYNHYSNINDFKHNILHFCHTVFGILYILIHFKGLSC